VTCVRRGVAALVAAGLLWSAQTPAAQGPLPISDRHIVYILPQWTFVDASDADVAEQVSQLRARIGEGPRVRVGFTQYVSIVMHPHDPDDIAAVRAGLAPALARVDAAIARARTHGIALCVTFLTAIRSWYDPAQQAAELADRRNTQWHADNSLAAGWATHSRYARGQRRLKEAYLRELGRAVAARMAADPDTFVAAGGDGEVELSYARSVLVDSTLTQQTSALADYSPLAIAEFRDWLRQGGLYAPGQPFAGEAWESSGRYAGDASPGLDTSGDGHTLNGDYGTVFATWDLRYFDWLLSDDVDVDPRAIPAAEYETPQWSAFPPGIPGGFDAPRTVARGTPWWDLWNQFRQTMIWRSNLEFAKWITTSADPVTGYTVPVERWFSDQIPADYLFGNTPQNPDFRLLTSASPHWTADVSPYGSLGITSFNVNLGNNTFGRTLAGVAPVIAGRNVRWGIFEWNPAVPSSPDIAVYRQEMALVEEYKPSLLVPYFWGRTGTVGRIEDTGFEVALRELVERIKRIPLTLSRSTLVVAGAADASARTPAQTVRVGVEAGALPFWTIQSASSFLEVAVGSDGRSFSVAAQPVPMPPGHYTGTVVVAPGHDDYAPVTLTVELTVTSVGASTPPRGVLDTPPEDTVVFGEKAVTGWAIDDLGVAAVEIYRSPMPGEPTRDNGLVFIGTATFVEGSRTDVEALNPTTPMNARAGWGYMLLTNMLPDAGNGLFTLWAVARDVEGHTAVLGSRRIIARNREATLPFGTIDTPRQGETVSGTIVNFGWALTPPPHVIPFDGSTIGVYVDGVFRGRPVYNNPRADIIALFPGYANTNGAVGHFHLDTTTLANGVHTIAWSVFDSAGRGQGIGSRFFIVNNP
jgi:hypothetical protein